MRSDVRITARELPLRARRLGTDELTKVFGGCSDEKGACNKDSDCCAPYRCYSGNAVMPAVPGKICLGGGGSG